MNLDSVSFNCLNFLYNSISYLYSVSFSDLFNPKNLLPAFCKKLLPAVANGVKNPPVAIPARLGLLPDVRPEIAP